MMNSCMLIYLSKINKHATIHYQISKTSSDNLTVKFKSSISSHNAVTVIALDSCSAQFSILLSAWSPVLGLFEDFV